ncbi:sensor histidine kinase [Mucilaginibacter ginsenosidivorans]|uniref:histidine kinase n=1 Tax=Mucilaginibacter ginsenosidivorans TaxID=398053 RepID=A0A5B8V0D2_9SPHI|nr:ATP-binding protein [Mucilaginibacter ginsenosidivorans]QEC64804.1 hypothetical protein FRZ54_20285 [Mucilaginibacter ginsenosidivorans]
MPKTSDNLFVLLLISIVGAFLLIVSFILLQIRAQNRVLKEKRKLAEAETQYQKDLLHSVIRFQEDDRKRIGQNLHDDVGGQLAVLRMQMDDNDGNDAGVAAVDRIIENVRNISHSLSPQFIPVLHLWEVVEQLCENLEKASRLHVQFTSSESARSTPWGPDVSLAVYRVLQELVSNTLKHSGATAINLNFDVKDDNLLISYIDNGKGMDGLNLKKGMGMYNIISRLQMLQASWKMNSPRGQGYHFSMIIPPQT